MMRFGFLIICAIVGFSFIEDVRDYVEIRWTAYMLRWDARIALNEQTDLNYRGIVTIAVWVDEGGQRTLTRTNDAQSTFTKWKSTTAPCAGCILDVANAVILSDGHGEFHGARKPRFENRNFGAAVVIDEVSLGAACRRENKIAGGGCRSIAAMAVGYVELPEVLLSVPDT